MTLPRRSEIDGYISELPLKERRIVRALRKIILREVPTVQESLLWGSLSYHRPWIGGRIKGAMCLITVKKDIVKLEFIHGVHLRDQHDLLKGTRKSKRYIVIDSVEEANSPHIITLIREAAEFNPNDWS